MALRSRCGKDARAHDVQDGKHTWEVPLAPFLGCLGVAPAMAEVRSTIVPGPFGGNMDCWEVRAGNTVFLGVNVSGALLSIGDGHYAMGEGEIMGAAIEGAMNVELYVELIKGQATPVPRIENADEVMFVGSGRPLEDAARVAFKAMVRWAQRQTGMSELDAYQFVSQNSRAPSSSSSIRIHRAGETRQGAPYFTGVASGFPFSSTSVASTSPWPSPHWWRCGWRRPARRSRRRP